MTFILASNNRKKLAELREILCGLGVSVISQGDAGLNIEAEETGATFAENALIKAKAACEASGEPCIADDSGLVVEALGGEPGVYSARYGGEGLSDRDRYELLLKNMEKEEHREAKFVSAIACVFPNGRVLTAEGSCVGSILHAPAGEEGFGYDPVFFVPEFGRSMAELTNLEKSGVSHRGNALREFVPKLKKYIDSEEDKDA